MLYGDNYIYLIIVNVEKMSMKQIDLDVKNDAGIHNVDDDHKAIFNYIKKLQGIVNQPKNHEYAIVILENFLAFFLEHVIKEEQLLQKYLPSKIVADHILLHQSELNYLDESIRTLKVKLSSDNIQTIAVQLNQEFKNHIYRYDKNIMQKLIEQKRLR